MIEWTPEVFRAFVGGCVLGVVFASVVSYTICMVYIDNETKRMQEKCNALERKNYKLIRFIKERRWE